MITPYDPLRGLDLYIDASGEDDWDVDSGRYYLHGFMCCGPSDEWLDWMDAHKTKYDGMIHWAGGKFGKQERELPKKKGMCRDFLATHPWFQAVIYAFDKKVFKEFLFRRYGRKIAKYEVVKRLWNIMAVTYLKTILPHIKKMVPDDPWGCLNVREIVINNPKGGSKSAIEKVIKNELGRTPRFVPAGHYGIDALDGVLWAFHRCFNLGKTDCLPSSVQEFSKDLSLVVFGIRSEKPVLLRSVGDIKEFSRKRSDGI